MIAKLEFNFVSAVMFGIVQPVFRNVLAAAIDRQKLITLSTAFRAAVNIVINYILIPVMSYNGAAIATVTMVAIITLPMFYVVSKHLRMIPVHIVIIQSMIAVLLMSMFVYYFINFNIIIIISLVIMVYIVVLLVLKTFSKADMEIVNNAIKLKKGAI